MDDVLLQWIAQMQAEGIEENNANAIGWVTISVDLEFGHLYVRGPYPTPEGALIAAAQDEQEVNRGNEEGEPGWRVLVYPLMPTGLEGARP